MDSRDVVFFPLRSEAEISGEKASAEHFNRLLIDTEFSVLKIESAPVIGCKLINNLQRLYLLYQIAKKQIGSILIVKVPTASQLPLALFLTKRYNKRILFWVDGLNWSRLCWSATVKLLLREPLLTISRMTFNNSLWVRMVKNHRLEIVVSSHFQKHSLKKLMSQSCHIQVIPNGTLRSDDPRPVSEKIHNDSSLNDYYTFGYIGHSYLTKGALDFLKALSQIRGKGRKFSAQFALSTLGGRSVAHIAHENGCVVHGKVNKNKFYSEVDILVFPYWTDWGTNVYPNVLLESMEHGVPVVTTDLEITRELFLDGNLALFVPPNRPDELAKLLLDVIDGKVELPSKSKLIESYETRFSFDVLKNKWLFLLRN